MKNITLLSLVAFLLFAPNLYAGTTSMVRGTITEANGAPAVGLTVKAFNKTMRGMALLGQTRTGARGEYLIRYTADGDVTLVVRVLNSAGQRLYESQVVAHASTTQTVDATLPAARPDSTATTPVIRPNTFGEVIDTTATAGRADTSFSASGTVTYANGMPASGLLVRALHKTARNVRTLGQARTDDSGYYRIRYVTQDDATLVVRVFDTAGRQIHESRPVMHAAGSEIVDVSLPSSAPDKRTLKPIDQPSESEGDILVVPSLGR